MFDGEQVNGDSIQEKLTKYYICLIIYILDTVYTDLLASINSSHFAIHNVTINSNNLFVNFL